MLAYLHFKTQLVNQSFSIPQPTPWTQGLNVDQVASNSGDLELLILLSVSQGWRLKAVLPLLF